MKLINIADLTNPETGKTYRQANLEKNHNIPLGTLVEVKFDDWFGAGACWKVHARLWIIQHARDCDGTPLYTISRWKDPCASAAFKSSLCGFSEESLTPVELTPQIREGYNALEWEETE